MNSTEYLEMTDMSINLDTSTFQQEQQGDQESGYDILKKLGPNHYPTFDKFSGPNEDISEIYDNLEKILTSNFKRKVKNALEREKKRTILHSGPKKYPEYELIVNGYFEMPSLIQKLSQTYGDPFNFKYLHNKKLNKYELEVSWDTAEEVEIEETSWCTCIIL